MLVAQKPAVKSHTSPGKTFAEKNEAWHSSTTYTNRLSVATIDKKSHSSCNYGMDTAIMGSCS